MNQIGWKHPQLRELVVEASQALARLDAERLEELALSCQRLNRDLARLPAGDRPRLAAEARAASGDMAVFGRVLEATRANLAVMERLRALRMGRMNYSAPAIPGWQRAETSHGDN